MPEAHWRRYAAPAAFLLAATLAIVLVRNGIEAGRHDAPANTGTVHVSPHKRGGTAKTRRFWTVRAGDTLAVISSKTGVKLAALRKLNPKVRSTSLFIGERIRLK